MALSLSPLVLPVGQYDFTSEPKRTALISTASIDFSAAPTLTGPGTLGGSKIRANVTIDVIGDQFIWLEATGQLLGSADIAFSESGRLANLTATETVSFSVSATLTSPGGS